MFNFLGETSPALKMIIDVLGVLGIIVFGVFVLVFVVDLLMSSSSDRQGIFFNRKKKNDVTYDNTQSAPQSNDNVVYYNTTAPEVKEEVDLLPVAPVESNEEVKPVDFDKAIEEQKELNSRFASEPQPVNFFDEEDDEEDISEIIDEVTKKALKEIEGEAKEEKPKKVFKIKTPEPVAQEENEEVKRLEEEREELARKLAELEELRKQDHEELLNAMKEIREKEPVVVEVDKSKEEDEKRKFANIARMNARLNSIKRNTEKLNKPKEKKQNIKTIVVEEEITPVEQPVVVEQVIEEPVVEKIVTVEKVIENKPRFKKDYYENRLTILEQELKDAEKELKANNKEFAPLTKVKKAYERDSEKLRRKEMAVAKQKVALYGVSNSNKKVNPAKKEKLDENVKQLKELKESVFHCEQVIEQNKDRFPILEKNNKLLNKQVKRLQDDIASVKEALNWYEQNSENAE